MTLALIFAVAVTAQVGMGAVTAPLDESAVHCALETAAPSDVPDEPGMPDHHKGLHALSCISCAVFVSVAAPPKASVPAEWARVQYAIPEPVLSGVSIQPELFPPILRI